MYNEKDIISKWNSEMYDCNETDTNDVEFALSVIGIEPKHILEIKTRYLIQNTAA